MPDAFLASVGAMIDSHSLVLNRLDHIVSDTDKPPAKLELLVQSIDGQPVRVGGNLLYPVDGPIASKDRFDFIWLPSFRIGDIEGLKAMIAASRPILKWLRDRRAEGAIIGASGSAAMLLVEAGMLDGKSVPVSPVFLPTARALYPRCQMDEKLMVVDHEGVILSSGISNDFAAIAQAMRRVISVYSGRWLAAVSSLEGSAMRNLAEDPLVANAQLWIEQQYASDLKIGELADRLSTSQQTLARRFRAGTGMTPKAYMQQLRVAAAKGMLTNTRLTIDTIARFCGFSDVRVFRQQFLKATGKPASSWRREHRGVDENYPLIEQ